ncbi:MAG: AAA family ATPase, partial [Thermoflexia bacterium]
YVLRANTVAQMEACLSDIAAENAPGDPFSQALQEAEEAIRAVREGLADEVELSPQNAFIRRRQHEMARQAGLLSYSVGEEPNRRVRIVRRED